MWSGHLSTQRPASPCLMLEMLQKALVKAIGVEMAGFVEPVAVARHPVGCVKAQARKHMRGDLGAFLRRIGVDRMEPAEFRGQHPKEAQLAGDLSAVDGPHRPSLRWIWVDRLPDAGDEVAQILCEQTMQKCRARAGQSGNEDRPLDRLIENLGRLHLLLAQP